MPMKILFAGESWVSQTTHIKGFDSFQTSVYQEGATILIETLKALGFDVTYLPNHKAIYDFPFTVEELSAYDCVILSDIGSNTLLLHPDTFPNSIRRPNRLATIRDYVLGGGGFMMVGGYFAYSGMDAKCKYGHTPLRDVLPVVCLDTDDLMEHPEGITPVVVKDHPALKNVPSDWPFFLGYNRTLPREGCETVMTVDGDPFLSFGAFGEGRAAAFATDCAPHWGPPEFLNWAGYAPLWKGIVDYITKTI